MWCTGRYKTQYNRASGSVGLTLAFAFVYEGKQNIYHKSGLHRGLRERKDPGFMRTEAEMETLRDDETIEGGVERSEWTCGVARHTWPRIVGEWGRARVGQSSSLGSDPFATKGHRCCV